MIKTTAASSSHSASMMTVGVSADAFGIGRRCQKATEGVSIALKSLQKSSVFWETQPDWYASSPIAKRPFCSACGTPLGFAYDQSDYIDATVGSFDDPSRFFPTENFGVESKHPAWDKAARLPNIRADQYDPLVSRWKAIKGDNET